MVTVIGDKSFKSKADAKNYIRGIIGKYRNDEPVSLADDDRFLRDLIAGHPHADEKIGCGIERFTVRADVVWRSSRHFVIIRTDGTETDFSFHTCLDGESIQATVRGAMRHAVRGQVLAFKHEVISGPCPSCPISGVALTADNSHVDHEYPATFSALADQWRTEQMLEWKMIVIGPSKDNQLVREMADPGQIESWKGFHRDNARLRLLSAAANLALSNGAPSISTNEGE